MAPTLQTAFLQALGYALINSFWQFALLWLVYVLLNTIIKFSSHQKYVTGVVLQFAGFIWFVATAVFYNNQLSVTPELSAQANTLTSAASVKDKVLLFITRSEQLLPVLSVIYMWLLLLLSMRWVNGYRQTQLLRTKGLQKAGVEWRLFVQRISKQLGIRHNVGVFVSEKITTPLTVGFLRPIILIPFAGINHLSAQQMEAVLLHELAHIKRSDYLLNLILAVIETALFFNPFMRLLSRQIKKERENCCDDWVLQYEYSPAIYARALLQIARTQSISPAFALNAAEDDRRILLSRVKRMLDRKESSFFSYRHQLLALVVMLTMFGAVAVLSSGKNAGNYDSNPLVQPFASKMSNPLFNPAFFIAEEETKAAPQDAAAATATQAQNVATVQESTTIKTTFTNKQLAVQKTCTASMTCKRKTTITSTTTVSVVKEQALVNQPCTAAANEATEENMLFHIPQLKELNEAQIAALLKDIKASIIKERSLYSNISNNLDFKFQLPEQRYTQTFQNAVYNLNGSCSEAAQNKKHTIVVVVVTDDEDAAAPVVPATAVKAAKAKKTMRI